MGEPEVETIVHKYPFIKGMMIALLITTCIMGLSMFGILYSTLNNRNILIANQGLIKNNSDVLSANQKLINLVSDIERDCFREE